MTVKPILLSLVAGMAGATGLTAAADAMSPARPTVGAPDVTNVAFVCIRDDHGWHYMRGKHRVVCRPSRPGADWIWHIEGGRSGWWHKKEHRWND